MTIARRPSLVAALLLAALLLGLAGCGPTAAPTPTADPATLVVFAASSLTDAFAELGQRYQAAHPGVRVTFNFGASNQLAEQLAQGAPADVFASANARQMGAAIDAGRVISGAQQTFATNRLIVVLPRDNPGRVRALPDLARPGLKLVLAAAAVPVGQYALDFLDKAGQDPAFPPDFKSAVLKNVVSYEANVRAVYTKVALGEADAGIVYASDASAAAAPDLGQVESLAIPDRLNAVAAYPIAPLADSPHASLAQGFVDLVLSAEGQAVLQKYGFGPLTD